MRKWITLPLVLIAFTAAWAVPSEAAKGKLTVVLTGEPPTMDPHQSSNANATIVWRWAYDTLVSAETGTGKRIPWLAERWERLSARQIKFWLRKGAKFADGTPVTAEAVKYSMSRVFLPELKSRQRPYFATFDRIEVLDGQTLIWHNKTTDNGTLNRLDRWGHVMSLQTKDIDKAKISRNTFGSGPYILKSWTKGQRMEFEANPNWWADKMYPNRPQTVVLRHIVEATTRVQALRLGEVEIINDVREQFVPALEKDPSIQVAAVPSVRIFFMSFLTRQPNPFADVNLRLAMNYAIDTDQIGKTIMGGRANPIGSLFHPWNYSGHNPKSRWHGFDLAKSKEYLKKSSYKAGEEVPLIATVGRYPADKPVCEATAGMLQRAGINAKCEATAYSLWNERFNAYQAGKKKGPAVFMHAFGNGTGDPGQITKALSSCKGFRSPHCFKDLDAQIDKAVATAEPGQQQAEFEKVTAILKDRALFKIYYQTHDVFAYRKSVEFTPRHDEALYVWEASVK
ncbi:MAG: hypothetical protein HYY66_01925 [Candidatus Tectomicrobia bacterium]|nr:hypothetical protein [Candidatus Tectomicrobia bacterium]